MASACGAGSPACEPAVLPASSLRLRLLPLLRKGTLAVTDQGLFSGANFLASVMLARWLAPAEYGAYSLAYSVFLLFAAVHSALLIEPMMIFGAGKYFDRFPRYLRLLLGFHVAVLVPASLALWVVAGILGRVYSATVQQAFQGLVVGSAFILLFWLVRRVFYVLTQPGWAVFSSCLYFATLAGAVGILWLAHSLTPFSAFLGMGLASLFASAILLARFIPQWKHDGPEPTLGEIAGDHWRYGRWAIAASAVSWFPGQVYYSLLPAWIGLEGAGALRALTNFVMPVLQAIAAVSMLLLPALVRDRREGGVRKMNQSMALFFGVFLAGCAVYLSALWVFRGEIFQLFYGGRYAQYAGWPLLLTGALPIGTCASAVLANGLRAMERPDRMFWAYIASSVAAVLIGIPCAAKFGVSGALIGIHVSSFTVVGVMWWFYSRQAMTPAKVEVV